MGDLVEVTGHPVRGHQQSDLGDWAANLAQAFPRPKQSQRASSSCRAPGRFPLVLASPTGVVVAATVASATRPLALGPTLSPCLDCWLSSAHRTRTAYETQPRTMGRGTTSGYHRGGIAQQGIPQDRTAHTSGSSPEIKELSCRAAGRQGRRCPGCSGVNRAEDGARRPPDSRQGREP